MNRDQHLITVKTQPNARKTARTLSQLWVQSQCIFDVSRGDTLDDPETAKRVNRVLEGVNRMNAHLREGGDVADTAKIFDACMFDDVLGEHLIIKGLSKEGGYTFSLSSAFARVADEEAKRIAFKNISETDLKAILGFQINTLEKDKNYDKARELTTNDPQSGKTYVSGSAYKKAKDGTITASVYLRPDDGEATLEAEDVPDFVSFEFKPVSGKGGKNAGYELTDVKFEGRKISLDDTDMILRLIGLSQDCNRDICNWKYPSFMDHIAKRDLLDKIDPLPVPKSLEKKGGELLYVSMHGSGTEKHIENFGDQIGIGGLFLQRGRKQDGMISTVGAVVDFPFASGGPDSNYDGAVPDYLPFWDDIRSFFITHDHFDHADGMAYYAKAGLMKKKDVYATPEVKYMLRAKMDYLQVPKNLRPKIHVLREEGHVALKDEDGVNRLIVQYSPNGTRHSARCTPYVVSGVYGNEHYNGSTVVYGDGNTINPSGREFFKKGLKALDGKEDVPKELLKSKYSVVLHDITAVRYEGHAPEPEDVEENLSIATGWFADKGVLMAPITTNDAEYTVAMNTASRTGRHITAVGSNAERRLACKNLFGVDPFINLREFALDPFEEFFKGDSIIPRDILEDYVDRFLALDDDDEEKGKVPATYLEALEQARKKIKKTEKDKVQPRDREHVSAVRSYIKETLDKHGQLVFENDVNGYLMWKAIMDGQDTASMRATRTSKMAKEFRDNPSELMIFVTGTQGNAEEHFSTVQKLVNYFSLLDANPEVQPTGYKINLQDYVAVITQSAIPGNENSQDRMIQDLVEQRDITVIGAIKDGFKVYNPKDKRHEIEHDLRRRGWNFDTDANGNLHVHGHSIHFHGHGFKKNLESIISDIPAHTHEVHHVPDRNSYDTFRRLSREKGFGHSEQQPEDFLVRRISAKGKKPGDLYAPVARLNPSYILVNMERKYGQFYNGSLSLSRVTKLAREGGNRDDGLMARTGGKDGTYQRKTAHRDWETANNDNTRKPITRIRKMGPGVADRGHGRKAQNIPLWSKRTPS